MITCVESVQYLCSLLTSYEVLTTCTRAQASDANLFALQILLDMSFQNLYRLEKLWSILNPHFQSVLKYSERFIEYLKYYAG